MQVIVPCVVMLPDEVCDINELEAHVLVAGQHAMAAAMSQAWEQYHEQVPACPRCGSARTVGDGQRAYHLRTRFGTVVLERQVAEAAGQAAAATAEQAATALVSGQRPVTPVERPPQLLIELDGGYVKSHDNVEGMAGKVAVIATGRTPVGRNRMRLRGRCYVASFGSAEQLGRRVYQAAAERGVEAAEQVVVLGDGARWISELAAWHFPTAERRLDLWHLLRRGHEAVAAEGLPDDLATAIWDDLRGQLRRGAVEQAVMLVQHHLSSATGREFARYLRNQRDWIVDAETLLAQGEVVGSGAIEKGVDLVLNRRLKGRRGMKWWRINADAMSMLRTQILNEEAA